MFVNTSDGVKVKISSRKRGYVGPLGDDVPSIFPIVAGILLLATTMWYVSTALSIKQSYFDLRKSALGISYALLDKGLLGWNYAEANATFFEKCSAAEAQAKIRGVDYAIVVKRFCGPLNLSMIELEQLFNPTVRGQPMPRPSVDLPGFFCSSAAGTPEQIAGNVTNATFVVLNYPIAVPCGDIFGGTHLAPAGVERGVGMLSVVVWRKRL